MPREKSIRRGGLARGLRLSLAGARAGGAFAVDGALKKLRGDTPDDDALLSREARRFARQLGRGGLRTKKDKQDGRLGLGHCARCAR